MPVQPLLLTGNSSLYRRLAETSHGAPVARPTERGGAPEPTTADSETAPRVAGSPDTQDVATFSSAALEKSHQLDRKAVDPTDEPPTSTAPEKSENATGTKEPKSADATQRADAEQETTEQADSKPEDKPARTTEKSATGEPLTKEQQEVVEKLKVRDREVRNHEQAHVAVAGQYALGGPTYTYQEGPDGNRYAIGGEVAIDTSPVAGDPEATVRKARVVRAAALAPAEPSGQDRAVAAAATKLEQQALSELREQNQNLQADTQAENSAPVVAANASGQAAAALVADLDKNSNAKNNSGSQDDPVDASSSPIGQDREQQRPGSRFDAVA